MNGKPSAVAKTSSEEYASTDSDSVYSEDSLRHSGECALEEGTASRKPDSHPSDRNVPKVDPVSVDSQHVDSSGDIVSDTSLARNDSESKTLEHDAIPQVPISTPSANFPTNAQRGVSRLALSVCKLDVWSNDDHYNLEPRDTDLASSSSDIVCVTSSVVGEQDSLPCFPPVEASLLSPRRHQPRLGLSQTRVWDNMDSDQPYRELGSMSGSGQQPDTETGWSEARGSDSVDVDIDAPVCVGETGVSNTFPSSNTESAAAQSPGHVDYAPDIPIDHQQQTITADGDKPSSQSPSSTLDTQSDISVIHKDTISMQPSANQPVTTTSHSGSDVPMETDSCDVSGSRQPTLNSREQTITIDIGKDGVPGSVPIEVSVPMETDKPVTVLTIHDSTSHSEVHQSSVTRDRVHYLPGAGLDPSVFNTTPGDVPSMGEQVTATPVSVIIGGDQGNNQPYLDTSNSNNENNPSKQDVDLIFVISKEKSETSVDSVSVAKPSKQYQFDIPRAERDSSTSPGLQHFDIEENRRSNSQAMVERMLNPPLREESGANEHDNEGLQQFPVPVQIVTTIDPNVHQNVDNFSEGDGEVASGQVHHSDSPISEMANQVVSQADKADMSPNYSDQTPARQVVDGSDKDVSHTTTLINQQQTEDIVEPSTSVTPMDHSDQPSPVQIADTVSQDEQGSEISKSSEHQSPGQVATPVKLTGIDIGQDQSPAEDSEMLPLDDKALVVTNSDDTDSHRFEKLPLETGHTPTMTGDKGVSMGTEHPPVTVGQLHVVIDAPMDGSTVEGTHRDKTISESDKISLKGSRDSGYFSVASPPNRESTSLSVASPSESEEDAYCMLVDPASESQISTEPLVRDEQQTAGDDKVVDYQRAPPVATTTTGIIKPPSSTQIESDLSDDIQNKLPVQGSSQAREGSLAHEVCINDNVVGNIQTIDGQSPVESSANILEDGSEQAQPIQGVYGSNSTLQDAFERRHQFGLGTNTENNKHDSDLEYTPYNTGTESFGQPPVSTQPNTDRSSQDLENVRELGSAYEQVGLPVSPSDSHGSPKGQYYKSENELTDDSPCAESDLFVKEEQLNKPGESERESVRRELSHDLHGLNKTELLADDNVDTRINTLSGNQPLTSETQGPICAVHSKPDPHGQSADNDIQPEDLNPPDPRDSAAAPHTGSLPSIALPEDDNSPSSAALLDETLSNADSNEQASCSDESYVTVIDTVKARLSASGQRGSGSSQSLSDFGSNASLDKVKEQDYNSGDSAPHSPNTSTVTETAHSVDTSDKVSVNVDNLPEHSDSAVIETAIETARDPSIDSRFDSQPDQGVPTDQISTSALSQSVVLAENIITDAINEVYRQQSDDAAPSAVSPTHSSIDMEEGDYNVDEQFPDRYSRRSSSLSSGMSQGYQVVVDVDDIKPPVSPQHVIDSNIDLDEENAALFSQAIPADHVLSPGYGDGVELLDVDMKESGDRVTSGGKRQRHEVDSDGSWSPTEELKSPGVKYVRVESGEETVPVEPSYPGTRPVDHISITDLSQSVVLAEDIVADAITEAVRRNDEVSDQVVPRLDIPAQSPDGSVHSSDSLEHATTDDAPHMPRDQTGSLHTAGETDLEVLTVISEAHPQDRPTSTSTHSHSDEMTPRSPREGELGASHTVATSDPSQQSPPQAHSTPRDTHRSAMSEPSILSDTKLDEGKLTIDAVKLISAMDDVGVSVSGGDTVTLQAIVSESDDTAMQHLPTCGVNMDITDNTQGLIVTSDNQVVPGAESPSQTVDHVLVPEGQTDLSAQPAQSSPVSPGEYLPADEYPVMQEASPVSQHRNEDSSIPPKSDSSMGSSDSSGGPVKGSTSSSGGSSSGGGGSDDGHGKNEQESSQKEEILGVGLETTSPGAEDLSTPIDMAATVYGDDREDGSITTPLVQGDKLYDYVNQHSTPPTSSGSISRDSSEEDHSDSDETHHDAQSILVKSKLKLLTVHEEDQEMFGELDDGGDDQSQGEDPGRYDLVHFKAPEPWMRKKKPKLDPKEADQQDLQKSEMIMLQDEDFEQMVERMHESDVPYATLKGSESQNNNTVKPRQPEIDMDSDSSPELGDLSPRGVKRTLSKVATVADESDDRSEADIQRVKAEGLEVDRQAMESSPQDVQTSDATDSVDVPTDTAPHQSDLTPEQLKALESKGIMVVPHKKQKMSEEPETGHETVLPGSDLSFNGPLLSEHDLPPHPRLGRMDSASSMVVNVSQVDEYDRQSLGDEEPIDESGEKTDIEGKSEDDVPARIKEADKLKLGGLDEDAKQAAEEKAADLMQKAKEVRHSRSGSVTEELTLLEGHVHGIVSDLTDTVEHIRNRQASTGSMSSGEGAADDHSEPHVSESQESDDSKRLPTADALTDDNIRLLEKGALAMFDSIVVTQPSDTKEAQVTESSGVTETPGSKHAPVVTDVEDAPFSSASSSHSKDGDTPASLDTSIKADQVAGQEPDESEETKQRREEGSNLTVEDIEALKEHGLIVDHRLHDKDVALALRPTSQQEKASNDLSEFPLPSADEEGPPQKTMPKTESLLVNVDDRETCSWPDQDALSTSEPTEDQQDTSKPSCEDSSASKTALWLRDSNLPHPDQQLPFDIIQSEGREPVTTDGEVNGLKLHSTPSMVMNVDDNEQLSISDDDLEASPLKNMDDLESVASVYDSCTPRDSITGGDLHTNMNEPEFNRDQKIPSLVVHPPSTSSESLNQLLSDISSCDLEQDSSSMGKERSSPDTTDPVDESPTGASHEDIAVDRQETHPAIPLQTTGDAEQAASQSSIISDYSSPDHPLVENSGTTTETLPDTREYGYSQEKEHLTDLTPVSPVDQPRADDQDPTHIVPMETSTGDITQEESNRGIPGVTPVSIEPIDKGTSSNDVKEHIARDGEEDKSLKTVDAPIIVIGLGEDFVMAGSDNKQPIVQGLQSPSNSLVSQKPHERSSESLPNTVVEDISQAIKLHNETPTQSDIQEHIPETDDDFQKPEPMVGGNESSTLLPSPMTGIAALGGGQLIDHMAQNLIETVMDAGMTAATPKPEDQTATTPDPSDSFTGTPVGEILPPGEQAWNTKQQTSRPGEEMENYPSKGAQDTHTGNIEGEGISEEDLRQPSSETEGSMQANVSDVGSISEEDMTLMTGGQGTSADQQNVPTVKENPDAHETMATSDKYPSHILSDSGLRTENIDKTLDVNQPLSSQASGNDIQSDIFTLDGQTAVPVGQHSKETDSRGLPEVDHHSTTPDKEIEVCLVIDKDTMETEGSSPTTDHRQGQDNMDTSPSAQPETTSAVKDDNIVEIYPVDSSPLVDTNLVTTPIKQKQDDLSESDKDSSTNDTPDQGKSHVSAMNNQILEVPKPTEAGEVKQDTTYIESGRQAQGITQPVTTLGADQPDTVQTRHVQEDAQDVDVQDICHPDQTEDKVSSLDHTKQMPGGDPASHPGNSQEKDDSISRGDIITQEGMPEIRASEDTTEKGHDERQGHGGEQDEIEKSDSVEPKIATDDDIGLSDDASPEADITDTIVTNSEITSMKDHTTVHGSNETTLRDHRGQFTSDHILTEGQTYSTEAIMEQGDSTDSQSNTESEPLVETTREGPRSEKNTTSEAKHTPTEGDTSTAVNSEISRSDVHSESSPDAEDIVEITDQDQTKEGALQPCTEDEQTTADKYDTLLNDTPSDSTHGEDHVGQSGSALSVSEDKITGQTTPQYSEKHDDEHTHDEMDTDETVDHHGEHQHIQPDPINEMSEVIAVDLPHSETDITNTPSGMSSEQTAIEDQTRKYGIAEETGVDQPVRQHVDVQPSPTDVTMEQGAITISQGNAESEPLDPRTRENVEASENQGTPTDEDQPTPVNIRIPSSDVQSAVCPGTDQSDQPMGQHTEGLSSADALQEKDAGSEVSPPKIIDNTEQDQNTRDGAGQPCTDYEQTTDRENNTLPSDTQTDSTHGPDQSHDGLSSSALSIAIETGDKNTGQVTPQSSENSKQTPKREHDQMDTDETVDHHGEHQHIQPDPINETSEVIAVDLPHSETNITNTPYGMGSEQPAIEDQTRKYGIAEETGVDQPVRQHVDVQPSPTDVTMEQGAITISQGNTESEPLDPRTRENVEASENQGTPTDEDQPTPVNIGIPSSDVQSAVCPGTDQSGQPMGQHTEGLSSADALQEKDAGSEVSPPKIIDTTEQDQNTRDGAGQPCTDYEQTTDRENNTLPSDTQTDSTHGPDQSHDGLSNSALSVAIETGDKNTGQVTPQSSENSKQTPKREHDQMDTDETVDHHGEHQHIQPDPINETSEVIAVDLPHSETDITNTPYGMGSEQPAIEDQTPNYGIAEETGVDQPVRQYVDVQPSPTDVTMEQGAITISQGNAESEPLDPRTRENVEASENQGTPTDDGQPTPVNIGIPSSDVQSAVCPGTDQSDQPMQQKTEGLPVVIPEQGAESQVYLKAAQMEDISQSEENKLTREGAGVPCTEDDLTTAGENDPLPSNTPSDSTHGTDKSHIDQSGSALPVPVPTEDQITGQGTPVVSHGSKQTRKGEHEEMDTDESADLSGQRPVTQPDSTIVNSDTNVDAIMEQDDSTICQGNNENEPIIDHSPQDSKTRETNEPSKEKGTPTEGDQPVPENIEIPSSDAHPGVNPGRDQSDQLMGQYKEDLSADITPEQSAGSQVEPDEHQILDLTEQDSIIRETSGEIGLQDVEDERAILPCVTPLATTHSSHHTAIGETEAPLPVSPDVADRSGAVNMPDGSPAHKHIGPGRGDQTLESGYFSTEVSLSEFQNELASSQASQEMDEDQPEGEVISSVPNEVVVNVSDIDRQDVDHHDEYEYQSSSPDPVRQQTPGNAALLSESSDPERVSMEDAGNTSPQDNAEEKEDTKHQELMEIPHSEKEVRAEGSDTELPDEGRVSHKPGQHQVTFATTIPGQDESLETETELPTDQTPADSGEIAASDIPSADTNSTDPVKTSADDPMKTGSLPEDAHEYPEDGACAPADEPGDAAPVDDHETPTADTSMEHYDSAFHSDYTTDYTTDFTDSEMHSPGSPKPRTTSRTGESSVSVKPMDTSVQDDFDEDSIGEGSYDLLHGEDSSNDETEEPGERLHHIPEGVPTVVEYDTGVTVENLLSIEYMDAIATGDHHYYVNSDSDEEKLEQPNEAEPGMEGPRQGPRPEIPIYQMPTQPGNASNVTPTDASGPSQSGQGLTITELPDGNAPVNQPGLPIKSALKSAEPQQKKASSEKKVRFVDTQIIGFDVAPDQGADKPDDDKDTESVHEVVMGLKSTVTTKKDQVHLTADIQVLGLQPPGTCMSQLHPGPEQVLREEPTLPAQSNLRHAALNIEIKPWKTKSVPIEPQVTPEDEPATAKPEEVGDEDSPELGQARAPIASMETLGSSSTDDLNQSNDTVKIQERIQELDAMEDDSMTDTSPGSGSSPSATPMPSSRGATGEDQSDRKTMVRVHIADTVTRIDREHTLKETSTDSGISAESGADQRDIPMEIGGHSSGPATPVDTSQIVPQFPDDGANTRVENDGREVQEENIQDTRRHEIQPSVEGEDVPDDVNQKPEDHMKPSAIDKQSSSEDEETPDGALVAPEPTKRQIDDTEETKPPTEERTSDDVLIDPEDQTHIPHFRDMDHVADNRPISCVNEKEEVKEDTSDKGQSELSDESGNIEKPTHEHASDDDAMTPVQSEDGVTELSTPAGENVLTEITPSDKLPTEGNTMPADHVKSGDQKSEAETRDLSPTSITVTPTKDDTDLGNSETTSTQIDMTSVHMADKQIPDQTDTRVDQPMADPSKADRHTADSSTVDPPKAHTSTTDVNTTPMIDMADQPMAYPATDMAATKLDHMADTPLSDKTETPMADTPMVNMDNVHMADKQTPDQTDMSSADRTMPDTRTANAAEGDEHVAGGSTNEDYQLEDSSVRPIVQGEGDNVPSHDDNITEEPSGTDDGKQVEDPTNRGQEEVKAPQSDTSVDQGQDIATSITVIPTDEGGDLKIVTSTDKDQDVPDLTISPSKDQLAPIDETDDVGVSQPDNEGATSVPVCTEDKEGDIVGMEVDGAETMKEEVKLPTGQSGNDTGFSEQNIPSDQTHGSVGVAPLKDKPSDRLPNQRPETGDPIDKTEITSETRPTVTTDTSVTQPTVVETSPVIEGQSPHSTDMETDMPASDSPANETPVDDTPAADMVDTSEAEQSTSDPSKAYRPTADPSTVDTSTRGVATSPMTEIADQHMVDPSEADRHKADSSTVDKPKTDTSTAGVDTTPMADMTEAPMADQQPMTDPATDRAATKMDDMADTPLSNKTETRVADTPISETPMADTTMVDINDAHMADKQTPGQTDMSSADRAMPDTRMANVAEGDEHVAEDSTNEDYLLEDIVDATEEYINDTILDQCIKEGIVEAVARSKKSSIDSTSEQRVTDQVDDTQLSPSISDTPVSSGDVNKPDEQGPSSPSDHLTRRDGRNPTHIGEVVDGEIAETRQDDPSQARELSTGIDDTDTTTSQPQTTVAGDRSESKPLTQPDSLDSPDTATSDTQSDYGRSGHHDSDEDGPDDVIGAVYSANIPDDDDNDADERVRALMEEMNRERDELIGDEAPSEDLSISLTESESMDDLDVEDNRRARDKLNASHNMTQSDLDLVGSQGELFEDLVPSFQDLPDATGPVEKRLKDSSSEARPMSNEEFDSMIKRQMGSTPKKKKLKMKRHVPLKSRPLKSKPRGGDSSTDDESSGLLSPGEIRMQEELLRNLSHTGTDSDIDSSDICEQVADLPEIVDPHVCQERENWMIRFQRWQRSLSGSELEYSQNREWYRSRSLSADCVDLFEEVGPRAVSNDSITYVFVSQTHSLDRLMADEEDRSQYNTMTRPTSEPSCAESEPLRHKYGKC